MSTPSKVNPNAIEHQIARALGVELDECQEYVGELYSFTIKNSDDVLVIMLDRGVAEVYTQHGNLKKSYNIKITLE